MKVLSLFDGISCARVALERAGIPVEAYYASEIDKYAMQVSAKNWPDIVQVGPVQEYKDMWPVGSHGFDLLIGGSPCQDLSIAKAGRKGLAGERSGLFWEFVRILDYVKPKWWILENVASMPKEAKQIITDALGVEPIMIDAALVSAQRRKRLFWTNIPGITQPEDRGILLNDILETEESVGVKYNRKKGVQGEIQKAGTMSASDYRGLNRNQDQTAVYQYRRTYWRETKGGKVPTLTANMGTGGNNVPYVEDKSYCVPATYYKENVKSLQQRKKKGLMVDGIRKLTPLECERLQSLPDNYTEGISNTQRYKALGNGFNVEVIAHILSFIPSLSTNKEGN